MKIFSFFVCIFMMFSCTSNKYVNSTQLPINPNFDEKKKIDIEIIGILNIEFEAPGHTNDDKYLYGKAYDRLLEEAKKIYGENIDITGISFKKTSASRRSAPEPKRGVWDTTDDHYKIGIQFYKIIKATGVVIKK